jgi:carboxyl-terminal processing protease
MRILGPFLVAAALAGAYGCGTSTDSSSSSGSTTWTAGSFSAASTFVAQCATPRTGTDPSTGKAYLDKPGSTLTENNWLRSWSHDLYLWYREVPDLDPASYATADYFNVLKTSATTPSGNPKDKFHFTYPTPQWLALSQSGVEAGYGAQWVLISSRPPRQAVVAFT